MHVTWLTRESQRNWSFAVVLRSRRRNGLHHLDVRGDRIDCWATSCSMPVFSLSESGVTVAVHWRVDAMARAISSEKLPGRARLGMRSNRPGKSGACEDRFSKRLPCWRMPPRLRRWALPMTLCPSWTTSSAAVREKHSAGDCVSLGVCPRSRSWGMSWLVVALISSIRAWWIRA